MSASENSHAGDRPVVLVCDDDVSVLKLTEMLLDQHGYRVVPVNTGQSALDQAIAQQPAAILMDLRMPGMNGLATMAALKENPQTSHIPVIVFSSQESSERAADPRQVVAWVSKPIVKEHLLEALREALSRRARRAAAPPA